MSLNRATTTMHSLTTKTRLFGLGLLLAGFMIAAPSAHAAPPSFGIQSFTASSSSTQAGAHADLSTSFTFNTDSLGNTLQQAKDVKVTLPPGVVGNPQAIPKCSDLDFQAFACPADSQVGILNASFVTSPGVGTTLTAANLAPTTLTASVGPCSGLCDTVTLSVTSATGIQSGDYLTICGVTATPCDVTAGGQAEHVTVLSVSGDTITALTGGPVKGTCGPDLSLPTNVDYCPLSGMYYTHASGDLVYDDTISVANTHGFEGFDGGNNITIGTAGSGDFESDTIAFFPGNLTHLDLENPLQNIHNTSEPVVHPATTASAGVPVFNLQPDPGHVATLAASLLVATIPIQIDLADNNGTYQLTATISDISSLLNLAGTQLTLWGVPGDPSHNAQRCNQIGQQCGIPYGASITPFMTNPTNCPGGALTTTLSVDSWQGGSASGSAKQAAPTGCSNLSFKPTVSASPDTSQADTPAGYDVNVGVPQNSDPYGLATPDVQNVKIVLPSGVAISPAVANGLAGCTDAQFAAGACPNASKVGTVSIATPLLPDPLTGSVWIGQPTAQGGAAAAAGQMYRLFLTASADNATISLKGEVEPNGSTGQLTAVFDNNPQLPFSALNVHFYGGPLAALANPESCGSFTTTSAITGYGSATATPSSSFNITGCTTPTPFSPSFTAGTTNPTAGAYSPFTLTFSRSDSDKELSGITATLPPGLFAKIAGVTQCTNAQASSDSCPASSQVGTATVGAGAGSHPIFLTGKVYLTGPYNGGAYGLATVVPAIAGPYNLGTVTVRQALDINPNDAHVTAVSDPFPTILDGVPLRIKTINLDLNRPDFIINPTSCQPFQIAATISSVGGSTSSVSSPFQVGSCAELPFNPSLGIALSGKGQTKTGRHPTLTATLTAPSSGQANLKSAQVTLPLSLALDPRNTQVVCSVADAAAIACPSNTIVGTSSAISPLLPDPLSGNVYIVQGIRTNAQGQQIKTLPSLLIPLRGDIALNLQAQTSVNSAGQLVTTFPAIPDAAVSNFQLTITGGSHGILVVTGGQNICKSKQIGSSVLGSQSGKTVTSQIKFATPACGKKHGKRHHGKRHHGKRHGKRHGQRR
jgi:hypothetical protein